jgi:hypothetical protein
VKIRAKASTTEEPDVSFSIKPVGFLASDSARMEAVPI